MKQAEQAEQAGHSQAKRSKKTEAKSSGDRPNEEFGLTDKAYKA